MFHPAIIQGGDFHDARGTMRFVNGFDMSQIKRMYIIEHPDITIVRAWQAHQREQKWFFVLEGMFHIQTVQPDDWITPSKTLHIQSWSLTASENKILHIPSGFANGFRALERNSKLLIFSDFDMDQAATDNFRFDKDYWNSW